MQVMEQTTDVIVYDVQPRTRARLEWRPRLCCACGLLIWPLARRHRMPTRLGERFMHHGHCPTEPREPDPFPAYTKTDALIDRLNCWMAALVMCAIGAGVLFSVYWLARGD